MTGLMLFIALCFRVRTPVLMWVTAMCCDTLLLLAFMLGKITHAF
jgi:hypothetical protein